MIGDISVEYDSVEVSTETELTAALATTGATVTLASDISLTSLAETLTSASTYLTSTSDEISEYVINLGGKTLTLEYSGSTSLYIEPNSTVTIKNGNLKAYNSYSGTRATIAIGESATLILDEVDYDGGIIYTGNYSSLIIKDSDITSYANYAIGSNASVKSDGSTDVVTEITITNSTITNTRETNYDGTENGDGTATPICLNVPGSLTIESSPITGGLQAVIVRGATATITDSTLESKALYVCSNSKMQAGADVWGSGSVVPYATLVAGNKSASGVYAYETNVTLENTSIIMAQTESNNEIGPLYIAADNGYSTYFNYDSDTKAKYGDTDYEIGNLIGASIVSVGDATDETYGVYINGDLAYSSST